MLVEEKAQKIKFEDVKVGQCFRSDYDVYIKTNGDLENNAVCLNDGKLWMVGDDATVIPVNAKAVID